ncbi:MAG: AI-2E family transporter, partial [Gemmatimonadetes bacterium]|nr:AI-2E family transporter [Gemmatimonadota bacterium]
MTSERVQKTFLLLLLAAVSLLFLAMIRPFLMTIVLAAIAAGLCNPLYRRLSRWLRGRRVLAAAIVLVAVLVVVVAPLATLTGVVVNEGFKVTDTVRPWVQQRIEDPTYVERRITALPYSEFLLEHRAEIYRKAGEVVGGVGNWLVGNLSDVTKGTVSFLFQLGVL